MYAGSGRNKNFIWTIFRVLPNRNITYNYFIEQFSIQRFKWINYSMEILKFIFISQIFFFFIF